jgi:adhesin/invasin
MTVSQPVGTTDVNGEVIGAVSATTAGSYNVSATVDGSVLVSQTASVTVTPGAVSPAQSLVVAASPSITAGGSSSITVTVQDANNNPISGAAVQLTAAGMTVTQPVGTTDVNGEATGSVSATAVGLYSVSATVDGTAAITQAASVTVTPGAVSVAQSLVSVGSGTVISGTGTTLTLQTKDAAGNNLTTDGLTVVFTLGGGSSIGTIGGVSYQGNGVYTAPFDGVIAGSPTTIEVTIEGNAVTSTLPTITVTPGAVSTAISEVSVGSGTVISGTGTTLTLQTKDAAGNNLTTGGLTVSFGLGTGTSTGTITPDPATDNGDGTYLATFDGLLVGTPTTITATIDGNAVTSALPTITVTP